MKKEEIYSAIGKTLAPVEIESEEAMEDFGITKKDLVPLMVGNKCIMVYPYPAPEEVCREMLRDLRQRYLQEKRSNRCVISGARGTLRACPVGNSCEECPFGKDEKLPRQVSLDFLQEEGMDWVDPDSDCLPRLNAVQFLEHLKQINPRYAAILKLRGEGYTEPEIGQMLRVTRDTVKYARVRIREIAVEFFEGGAVL